MNLRTMLETLLAGEPHSHVFLSWEDRKAIADTLEAGHKVADVMVSFSEALDREDRAVLIRYQNTIGFGIPILGE